MNMMVNKRMKLDEEVEPSLRIPLIHNIEKMRPEYKNKIKVFQCS